jgi:hypothetical protein
VNMAKVAKDMALPLLGPIVGVVPSISRPLPMHRLRGTFLSMALLQTYKGTKAITSLSMDPALE